MATTTPNFGWDIPQSTDLVKDGATAIAALGTDIDTALVDLKGGTTGQVLSKNSNTDLDFTWVAQDDSNAIQNALLTTTGDTIYASGASTPARLGIGTTGQVLTVSGGLPTWATPSAGGYTLISSQQPSAVSSLSFSSIPSTYKHLVLTWNGIFHSTTGSSFGLRFNNNSTDYNWSGIGGQNSVSITGSGGSSVWQGIWPFGEAVTLTSNSDRGHGSLIIYNYASTSLFKNYWINFYFNRSDGQRFVATGTGLFGNTSAISSIDIFRSAGTATLSTGTSCAIQLYGVS